MADDDEEWRYSVDDFPDDGPGESPAGNGADTADIDAVSGVDGDGDSIEPASENADESGGNVAGQVLGLEEELEPGAPTLENTVFVLLGAAATVLFFLVVVGVI